MNELVTITGIAAGGDGVGRLADGRAVFVPRAAPGERVRLKPDGLTLHKSFARGELDTVLEPVATRVTPPSLSAPSETGESVVSGRSTSSKGCPRAIGDSRPWSMTGYASGGGASGTF